MADNGPKSESPLLTKHDLLECFASASFARHVQAAVSPTLDKLIIAINRHEKAFKEQENELSQLRSVVDEQRLQIRTQAAQIKILNLKQAQQEAENKKEQLNTLIISGLNEENPKEDFIETTKNKLNIELKESDFSLTIRERKQPKARKRTGNGKNGIPEGETPREAPAAQTAKPFAVVKFNNIWKKRELYSARGGLRGTDVFMSEDISAKQRALFYQCRQLRKKREIKQTWTQDMVVYILTHDGEKIVVNSDADLAPWTEPTPQANKDVLPAYPTQKRTAPQHTVQEPPARTLWTYESTSEGSFTGFDQNDPEYFWTSHFIVTTQ